VSQIGKSKITNNWGATPSQESVNCNPIRGSPGGSTRCFTGVSFYERATSERIQVVGPNRRLLVRYLPAQDLQCQMHNQMKRVLQHSKTGLFLSTDGHFSRHSAEAIVCPNLAAAMLVCSKLRLNPSDFVYRIVEPEYTFVTPDFYAPRQAA
jgi:hypothetical protein